MTVPMLEASSSSQLSWPDTEIPDEWCRGIEILFEGGDIYGGLEALGDYCGPGFYPTISQMHILLYIICHQPTITTTRPSIETRPKGRKKTLSQITVPPPTVTQSKQQAAIATHARSALTLLRNVTAALVVPSLSLTLSFPTPIRGSSREITSYEVNPLYTLPTNAKEFIRKCTGGVWDILLESESDARLRVRKEEWTIQVEERKRMREKESRKRKRQKEKMRKARKRAKRDPSSDDLSSDWDRYRDRRAGKQKKEKSSTKYRTSTDSHSRSRSRSFDASESQSEDAGSSEDEDEQSEGIMERFVEKDDGDDSGGEVVRAGCWGLVRWLVELWGVKGECGDGDLPPPLKALLTQLPFSQSGSITDISRPIAIIKSAMIPTLVANPNVASLLDKANKEGEAGKKADGAQAKSKEKPKARTRVMSEEPEDALRVGNKTEQQDEEGVDSLDPYVRVELLSRRKIASSLIDSLHCLTQGRSSKLELALLVSQLSNVALSLPVSFLSGFLEVLDSYNKENNHDGLSTGVCIQAIRSICGLGRNTVMTSEKYDDVERMKTALQCDFPAGRSASCAETDELAKEIRRLHMLKMKLIEKLKRVMGPQITEVAGADGEQVRTDSNEIAQAKMHQVYPTAAEARAALWPFESTEEYSLQSSPESVLLRDVKARIERDVEKLFDMAEEPKIANGQ